MKKKSKKIEFFSQINISEYLERSIALFFPCHIKLNL